jgi:hypothetical protein
MFTQVRLHKRCSGIMLTTLPGLLLCDLDFAVRVSHVADWIERNTCALSEAKEALSFCPDLVCPNDARLLGYPWVLLPNGTGSVVGIQGFDPVRVTQWPPPGTPLWRGTTTNVTMTAIYAAGRKLECVWVVLVAPLVELGQLDLDLPNGTYTTSGQFQRTAPQAITGRNYKMSGKTGDQLSGSGSSAAAKLRHPSDKYTGRPLRLKQKLNQNETKGRISVPRVPLDFGGSNTSDVELVVKVVRNARANNATFKVYGQVLEYLF